MSLPLSARFRIRGLDLASNREVEHEVIAADWRGAVRDARARGMMPLRISMVGDRGATVRTWKLDLDGELEGAESSLLEHPVATIAAGLLVFCVGALLLMALLRGCSM